MGACEEWQLQLGMAKREKGAVSGERRAERNTISSSSAVYTLRIYIRTRLAFWIRACVHQRHWLYGSDAVLGYQLYVF